MGLLGEKGVRCEWRDVHGVTANRDVKRRINNGEESKREERVELEREWKGDIDWPVEKGKKKNWKNRLKVWKGTDNLEKLLLEERFLIRSRVTRLTFYDGSIEKFLHPTFTREYNMEIFLPLIYEFFF